MLRWRLPLTVLIVAALTGLCLLDAQARLPGLWLLPVVLVATLLATGEVLDFARRAGMTPRPAVVYVVNLLLVLSPWTWVACRLCGCPIPGLGDNPLQVSVAALAPAVCVLALGLMWVFADEMRSYRQPGGITARIGAALLAMVYVGLMMCFAVSIRLGWGVGAMASWIIIVKMGDTGAYLVGHGIGRHKMFPLLSPGKTWEGAGGALLFSCLSSWAAFTWLLPHSTAAGAMAPAGWGWLPYGLLLGSAGVIGDVAESLLKRDVGCKDSSHWMPGFGGMLDLLDSLLLTAPLAWLCWWFGLVGR